MVDKKAYLPDARTQLYGIVGNPVEHSLSPVMHNAAMRELGVNAVYLAFCPSSARGAAEAIREFDVQGVSVTIPFKERLIPYLDQPDQYVEAIGAVNTIKNVEGVLHGTNTDWLGAVEALDEKIEIQDSRAVVLGAGGSARAVVFGLLKKGASVHIANRTLERAERLAKEFGCTFSGLDERSIPTGDILINTTSVGMGKMAGISPVHRDSLSGFRVVMDIVYSPIETRLLRDAKEQGCQTITGLRMLLFQAAAQFRYWFQMEPPIETMEKALYQVFESRDLEE